MHCWPTWTNTPYAMSDHAQYCYSGTPLNRHLLRADTHKIADNSESSNCPSIHSNIKVNPEQQTPHYCV